MTDPVSRTLSGMVARDPHARQERLAQALGKCQSTISRYLQGSDRGGLDLPAVLVPAVTAELGDALIEYLARACGGRFVREADIPVCASESCVDRSIHGVQTAVSYQAEAAAAESDRRVTREEHIQLLERARAAQAFAAERIAHHEAALRDLIASDLAYLNGGRR